MVKSFVIVIELLVCIIGSRTENSPSFPLQFTGFLEVTANLISKDQEYPPRTRRMKIYYDYINKLARADIEEGYEAEKSYIRQYSSKNEYMVRYPPINDCKRAYLGISSI